MCNEAEKGEEQGQPTVTVIPADPPIVFETPTVVEPTPERIDITPEVSVPK